MILSFLTLLGRGTKPCCKLHLTNSWAEVQPYLVLSSTTFGCSMRKALASGAYASTTMSFCWQRLVMFCRVLNGWTSI